VVLPQIYTETSTHNFVRIHSDLSFLSYVD